MMRHQIFAVNLLEWNTLLEVIVFLFKCSDSEYIHSGYTRGMIYFLIMLDKILCFCNTEVLHSYIIILKQKTYERINQQLCYCNPLTAF